MKKLLLAIMVVCWVLYSACAMPSAPTAPVETPDLSTPTPILTSPAEPAEQKISWATETKKTLTLEAKGLTVYYQQESFYSVDDFPIILERQEEFSSDLVEKFSGITSSYGKEITNAVVELDSEKRSALLKCNVNGVISKTGNSYYATFEWLIRPLELDFLDDHFEKSLNQLSWEGCINGVPTTILLIFPRFIDNCHAHVWWEG